METLKKVNRTLLEIWTAVAFWTVLSLIIGLFLPLESWSVSNVDWFLGLTVAGVLVVISTLHMQRCLERGLDMDEGAATKAISIGYFVRYVSFAVIVIITSSAGILDPLILCLGYLLIMKVAVYSQPFTHKFYNKLFHETDPVPEPLEEEIEVTE